MLDLPHPLMTINGRTLTDGQCVAVRASLDSFASYLAKTSWRG